MKFQAPRGTRDFYPEDMAWRNFLAKAWRDASIRNGFEEVDGPLFETLDLYKVKSGEGIVSELFSFRRTGGSTDYALRPEFTPTLARMVAARANALPKPIKWFAVPNFCRAERPQRGRLREFWQWNIDMLGVEGPEADAEVILTAVDFFRSLGLKPEHVKVKISHRETVRHILSTLGVPNEKMIEAFNLLDRRDKIPAEEFTRAAGKLGLDPSSVQRFEECSRSKFSAGRLEAMEKALAMNDTSELRSLDRTLRQFGLEDWCEYDLGVVRGLAYYTGVVFEIHEVSGAERAIAGGGRYDQLIELFGGSSMPAVGFGMGDVVVSLVLKDKGVAPEPASLAPRPDAFVFALTDAAAEHVAPIVTELRAAGLHARFTYRSTRNFGKLLKEATQQRARYALILDDQISQGHVQLKDLTEGGQRTLPKEAVLEALQPPTQPHGDGH